MPRTRVGFETRDGIDVIDMPSLCGTIPCMRYGPRPQSEERTITQAIASVVANLEMFRRRTVTSGEIAQMVGAPLGSDRHEWAVRSLVAHGWLIPLPVRGTYEFLPAESGPDRAGDPLTEAAAALKRDPGLRLQLVLGGAAFLGGFNERAPLRYTLIVPRQAPIQRGLAHAYDLIRAAPSRFFGATPRDGVAMSGASRLLFDAALWPTRAGDLRDPDHWLRAALARAEIADILAFAQRLDSDRVTARAGYFAEAFGRSDIAASLADLHPKAAVRLGDPAGPLHARDARFGVRDHLGVAGA